MLCALNSLTTAGECGAPCDGKSRVIQVSCPCDHPFRDLHTLAYSTQKSGQNELSAAVLRINSSALGRLF